METWRDSFGRNAVARIVGDDVSNVKPAEGEETTGCVVAPTRHLRTSCFVLTVMSTFESSRVPLSPRSKRSTRVVPKMPERRLSASSLPRSTLYPLPRATGRKNLVHTLVWPVATEKGLGHACGDVVSFATSPIYGTWLWAS